MKNKRLSMQDRIKTDLCEPEHFNYQDAQDIYMEN